ncbi:MAG TPA: glycosyltransferase [Leptolyngbyaceae cyanobacterium M33_DOE_097]|uniref:Glycosyltransferase n=1 Tax=Oscillatoriales cyanobacterium SpSt-418 TaxID=2282169 RepID=A0A7C3PIN7_9CYAN|nr:glycosyltransferase [Leptolyngbyaceae cyanobacterium M33_DOE_097]
MTSKPSSDVSLAHVDQAASGLAPITAPYLLTTSSLPCYIDERGRRYLDPLWVKDLREHVQYLQNLYLAAPCRYGIPPKSYTCLTNEPALSKIHFIDMPSPRNMAHGLLLLPQTFIRFWKVVNRVEIVHAGLAGWPIPYAWILAPITRLKKKFFLVNVESAPWRLEVSASRSLAAYLRAEIFEFINRFCVRAGSIVFFTHAQYRKSLQPNQPERGYVINASWIDEAHIISNLEATECWAKKRHAPLRVLFAARVVAQKGVQVLLAAMKELSRRGVAVQLDILGEGDLINLCEAVSQSIQTPVTINLLGTVSYGDEFFRLARNYHAIVIPNLSDEQPRLVYDAYSQAVPVLASETAGIRDCVQADQTGKLVPPGNITALADLLEWATTHIDELETMGMTALDLAHGLTHQEMHRRRWQILSKALEDARSNYSFFAAQT